MPLKQRKRLVHPTIGAIFLVLAPACASDSKERNSASISGIAELSARRDKSRVVLTLDVPAKGAPDGKIEHLFVIRDASELPPVLKGPAAITVSEGTLVVDFDQGPRSLFVVTQATPPTLPAPGTIAVSRITRYWSAPPGPEVPRGYPGTGKLTHATVAAPIIAGM